MLGQMRGEGKMFKKLMTGSVAAFLLVVAPEVMAQTVDGWFVAGETSASGQEYLEGEDKCAVAINTLTNEEGFNFLGSSEVEPRLVAIFFGSLLDSVTLFCVANINDGTGRPGEFGPPGRPGEPGKPGRPGGPL
jgi:hypothetical protein